MVEGNQDRAMLPKSDPSINYGIAWIYGFLMREIVISELVSVHTLTRGELLL